MLKKLKLPLYFKPLFWSYNFSQIDPQKNQQRIVINVINYGAWRHWQGLLKLYGRDNLKQIIRNIPASEFRGRALKLICLLLGIKKLKYASRSDYIQAKRNI